MPRKPLCIKNIAVVADGWQVAPLYASFPVSHVSVS